MRFPAFLVTALGLSLLGGLVLGYSLLKGSLGSQGDLSQSDLEKIVIDFLKTTDVSSSLWNDTVEIIEIYDHKLDGKVIIVNYTTVNAVHPHFMCEAIEYHTAIIMLNNEGQVTSAFCVWGSLHNDKIWDLINRRWIHQKTISEQEATQIGKSFLESISCTAGQVLFTSLEEKTPNFYWHNLAGLEKPDVEGSRLCWIIRFEQAYRPGHFFEVWIDAYTGVVVGGTQCR